MEKYRAWGVTILRVAVALVFLMHGGQKVFVYGYGGVAGSFAKMGIPLPALSAVVVMAVEFVGGALLLLGLFTRWVALLLAIDMAVAIAKVHLRGGFFLPRGYEYAFVLLCACLALALLGPGPAAMDRGKGRR